MRESRRQSIFFKITPIGFNRKMHVAEAIILRSRISDSPSAFKIGRLKGHFFALFHGVSAFSRFSNSLRLVSSRKYLTPFFVLVMEI